MKTSLLFSLKKGIASKLFAFAIIVSIVVPSTMPILVSADNVADAPVVSETSDAPQAPEPSVSITVSPDADTSIASSEEPTTVGDATSTTNETSTVVETDTVDQATTATETETSSSGGSNTPQAPDSMALGAPQTGSIMVCMVIEDDQGHIVHNGGSNVPAGTFKVVLKSGTNSLGVVKVATFNTADFTSSPIADGLDSQCITYNNLPFDTVGYGYSPEQITGADASYYIVPRYNDGDTLPPGVTQNFFHYGPGIYGDDLIPGLSNNPNSDGVLHISADHPTRAVFILNQYNTYRAPASCANGTELSAAEFIAARDNGDVSFQIETLTPSSLLAKLTVVNNTGCTIPVTFTSFKVHDSDSLASQTLFATSGLTHIPATQTTVLTIDVPTCMGQIDAWYGQAPSTLLASNPYIYPSVPFVFAYDYTFPVWGSPAGAYCQNVVGNNQPFISIIGANPIMINLGATSFEDPGATATDIEDGDYTYEQIVKTDAINTSVIGPYIRTYTITDSGGLSTSVQRVFVVVDNGNGGDNGGDNGGGGNGGGNNNGGGSGGGGGRSNNSNGRGGSGEVLGAETGPGTCDYLRDYLKQGWNNSVLEVLKAQLFLKNLAGFSDLQATGVFDDATFKAVSEFQAKYPADVLSPWGYNNPTGFVYILTQKKINEIVCKTSLSLTSLQEKEIADFRALLNDLEDANIQIDGNSNGVTPGLEEEINNIVGMISSTSTPVITLGTGDNTNPINPKDIRAVASAIFSIPNSREGVMQSIYFFLIAIIAIYLLTEIAIGSRDSSNLSKYQVWSRKAIGYVIGLVIAVIIAIYYQIFSIVVPLLVLAIASGVFLTWTMTKKDGSVITLPPSKRS